MKAKLLQIRKRRSFYIIFRKNALKIKAFFIKSYFKLIANLIVN